MIKLLFKGVSAFLTILMMATTLLPATTLEAQALGEDMSRMDLIQMRIARAMMDVAPEQSVAFYAKATKMPEHTIRAYLNAKADGTFMAQAGSEVEPMPRQQSAPQTFGGGAKFIKVD